MGKAFLLWDKPSDRGTISQGSWVAGLPLANLQNSDVQRVARSTNATTANTRFRVDLGSSAPEGVNSFAMLNHNLSTTAQWRIVVTSDATDTDAGQRVLDTGNINVWVPTVLAGTQAWGTFPWDGIDLRRYPSGTVVFYVTPSAVIARYIWVYITDTTNPAGYVQIGRFLSGAAWSPELNYSYGATLRYVDPSEVKRTRGGRRISLVKPRYRQIELKFDNLTQTEAYGVAFEVDRQLGKTGDFLLSLDPEESGEIRFRRTIYASLVDTSTLQIPYFDRWQWSITAEELI